MKISTDLIKKADAQSSVITHGIHHERKLNHDDELRSVIYNTVTEVLQFKFDMYAVHFFIRQCCLITGLITGLNFYRQTGNYYC